MFWKWQWSSLIICEIFFAVSDKTSTVDIKETWFPGVHIEIGGGTYLNIGGNERISKATLLWMIENLVEAGGGFLIRESIEKYRLLFSPDIGPSWNLRSTLVDRFSIIIPVLLHRDREIPLDKDPDKLNILKHDLLYRDGDWTLAFGDRKNLNYQYNSNAYEKLRQKMEKEGIQLYGNAKYDMFESARL
jgi:hypothetical protein